MSKGYFGAPKRQQTAASSNRCLSCPTDSDYQLGTPGQKATPDNGMVSSHHGGVSTTLRNGDVFCKQDNREVERERFIGRQVRPTLSALVLHYAERTYA